jgi:hypothetical protein
VSRRFAQGMKNSLQWRHLHDEGKLMAGGHNTTPTPCRSQALSSSISRTKTKDGRRSLPLSTQKSPFKPVESGQFQIGPYKGVGYTRGEGGNRGESRRSLMERIHLSAPAWPGSACRIDRVQGRRAAAGGRRRTHVRGFAFG